MRILFAGLGSIGSRHIRNLHSVLSARNIPHEIDAVRQSDSALRDGVAELLHKSYRSFDDLSGKYDIAFVTNPTAMHETTVRALAGLADNLFIEKPVFSDFDIDPDSLGLQPDGVYYVACPLRHTPVIRRMKAICETEPVRAARTICSSYLPDWRPGTDYRDCYSAHRELGGGVVLDLIHEWDYLSWLFGVPDEVNMFAGKFSTLDIDSDDLAVYIARYPQLLLSLHLDYLGRAPIRQIELFCDGATYRGDILARTVTNLSTGTVEQFENEDFYINEMHYFVDCVLGGVADTMNTIPHALAVLRAAAQ